MSFRHHIAHVTLINSYSSAKTSPEDYPQALVSMLVIVKLCCVLSIKGNMHSRNYFISNTEHMLGMDRNKPKLLGV